MEARLPAAVGIVIALAAVASGPLVGAVDLTPAPDTGAPTAERAEVTVESVPADRLHLEPSEFGAGRYHVDGPPALVTVDGVRGNPTLGYAIDIPALSYTARARYELAAAETDTLSLKHPPSGVSPSAIDRPRYNATVALWVRTGDRFDRLWEDRVVLEVAG